jgi:hypothetical protein
MTSPKGLKVHIIIQMLRSKKLSLKNLQMQKLMPPKVRANSRNEVALPLQKENTT